MDESIKDTLRGTRTDWKNLDDLKLYTPSMKLFIVCPKGGSSPKSLTDYDNHITTITSKDKITWDGKPKPIQVEQDEKGASFGSRKLCTSLYYMAADKKVLVTS